MDKSNELLNDSLEQVVGGVGDNETSGFKINDWVKFKAKTRFSPQGLPTYYRIREFGEQIGDFVYVYLDKYSEMGEGNFVNEGDYGSCLSNEIEHAGKPFGFED